LDATPLAHREQKNVKYFIPNIRVLNDIDVVSGPVEKFGGRPWGLKPSSWPTCKECGGSQSFIAQYAHHPDRIDLGRDGRMLFVFQCNHDPGMCSTWEGDSGCNACFILDSEELENNLCSLPADNPALESEALIVDWIEREDGVSSSDVASFNDEDKLLSLPEGTSNAVTTSTRLGGVPFWIQSPSEAPTGWEFIGQIDSTLSFYQAPKNTEEWVSVDEELWEGRTHYAEGPNFGDAGIAYLFLASEPNSLPKGWVFWQCG